MNKKINYGVILSIVLVIALLVSIGIGNNKINGLEDTITNKDDIISGKDSDITKMASEISTLNQNLVDATIVTDAGVEEEVVEESVYMYIVDGYSIGDTINEDFSDRELSLFDGEIEYDNEDYDANEYVVVGGKFVVNEDDFGSDVYMAFSEGDIAYNFVFEDEFEFGDGALKFNFLGEEIEVSEFDGDEITIKTTDEMIISEGETIEIDNNSIFLDMVMDGSIWITVNGESEKIVEDKCEKVGKVEVCVSEVLYSEKDTRVSKAIVAVASDVEESIESGDQYGDSEWSWYVDYTSKTIGLVLSEDFEDLDEDFTPLAVGDKLCLPNEYVCIEFGGLSDEEMSDIELEYDESDDETKISGDFEYDNEDVDELIVNSSGMYYEDEDDNMVKVTSVDFKNSDVVLEYNGNRIIMGDVKVKRDVSDIKINGELFTDDGSYRSVYGSIVDIDNELESNEDNEVSVSIPEEKLELSFFMY